MYSTPEKTHMSKLTYSTTSNPDDYKPTYGDPKVTAANDVALQKEPRFGAKQGILETQKEVGGQSYPGRPLPKAEAVTTAEVKTGVTTKCVQIQTGDNRYAINTHVEKKKEFGSNN